MKALSELCVPRDSVFDTQRRDTVLDLSDLIEDKIDPVEFFAENYITEGMEVLVEQGLRRLEGKSEQGVFKLTQAMGGGKTHNLLVLGLLARYPEQREPVVGHVYRVDPSLGPVKVVAFSGRESDAPLGLWGSIAEQLGKKEHFKDYYSPLQAPGQRAWESLLAGETVLILLDELPPYFESATAKAIGNSDLAQVTATALSNLLIALNRESCGRACLVITDLAATYQRGSQQISAVLRDLEHETNRSAMSLEPVRINSDELYHILRTRLFRDLPPDREVDAVAQAYAKAVRDAKQMDITNESPEQFAARVAASYPFHPAIRDLYARFRENPGFQQTRALIRIMRIVTSGLWNTGAAAKRLLINAYDLDFNDREVLAEVGQVNSTLGNAIAHDIASAGSAVAEVMDSNLGSTDTQDACGLLLVSSLANVPNAVRGLSIPELVAYLCEPGRDLMRLKGEVLEKLSTAAWYLHSTRDGKLFFKNVQNLNAKLESLVKTYVPEQAVRELRGRLATLFDSTPGWCYQRVEALPPLDEIQLEQDRVTLVITAPTGAPGLRRELQDFYQQTTWKNRIGVLTGSKDTYAQLLDAGKRLKAIQHILEELKSEKVADNDPQMIQAKELYDRIQQHFYSAVRETFTTLWYPLEEGLTSADFRMKFEGNRYSGEEQIRELLREKAKFTDEVSGEMFRKKCEQRLFTAQSLPWSEIEKRAAANPKWPWHRPDALDQLKADCIHKDIWREDGGFVDKGPFPQPSTTLQVNEQHRDDDTGEVLLRITPINADTVYYEVGAEATTASAKLDGATLSTKELELSLVAVDSTGVHETGPAVTWRNRITLKHRVYQRGQSKRLELRAVPKGTIKYTTDGSDPKVSGGVYDGEVSIPRGTQLVLAYAEADGLESVVERIPVKDDDRAVVDPTKPAVWGRKFEPQSTRDTYNLLERLKKHEAQGGGVRITISGEGTDREWVELTMYREKVVSPETLEQTIGALRELQPNGQVRLVLETLHFDTAQALIDLVAEVKTELHPGEVTQASR
jgi:hypothetical protein